MSQKELNSEIARVTGESPRTISRRGFSLLSSPPVEREPLMVDWDELEAERMVLFPVRYRQQLAAA